MTVFLFLALVVTWVTLGSRLSTLNQRLTELERQLRARGDFHRPIHLTPPAGQVGRPANA